MFHGTVLCLRRSEAICHACSYLSDIGIPTTEGTAPDVTHLLLPVPSFPTGDEYLAHILAELPEDVIVCGGNLRSPLLENYRAVDFLQDPYYLADNAAITAECAARILEEKMENLAGKRILILGWGRIGKCLSFALKNCGAEVSVAARKINDLAMIHALGFRPVPIRNAADEGKSFDAIVNTVPELLFPGIESKDGAILLELASKPGMTGNAIINGRGLPGRMAPQKSGKLIAETFIRLAI